MGHDPKNCTRTLASLFIIVILITASTAEQAGSAVEQFQSLRAELRKSHASNDWRSNLTNAKRLKELLNEAPSSLLEVARADVRLGDLDGAMRELEQFVRMGQSIDLLATSSDFAALVKRADFTRLQSAMKDNQKPTSLASTAFVLSDSSLLAEDVDYDPRVKRFFVTSVRERKIVSSDVRDNASEFAKAPDNWPMLAIKVDPARGVVWATEVAMRAFKAAPESDWGRSALLCFDLKDRKLLRRTEGPRSSALGDMVLTRDGDVIVSDGDGGGVYRAMAKGTTLERLDVGDFISPQTPAMHPDGKHVFVPDYLRGIGVLEIATKQVRWLSAGGRFALNGIDGLYFDDGKLIAVQNGTSPERVVAFTLDASLTKIESETIIERSTATLADPTHGVVIDNDFYYIANSGWDITDDAGNIKPGAKPSVPRIMRASLQGH